MPTRVLERLLRAGVRRIGEHRRAFVSAMGKFTTGEHRRAFDSAMGKITTGEHRRAFDSAMGKITAEDLPYFP